MRKKSLLVVLSIYALSSVSVLAQSVRLPETPQGLDDANRDIRLRQQNPLDSGLSKEKPQDPLQRVIDFNAKREKERDKQQQDIKGTSEDFRGEENAPPTKKKAKKKSRINSSLAQRQEDQQGKLKASANSLEKKQDTGINYDPTPVAPLPQETAKQTYGRVRPATAQREIAVILPPSVERQKTQLLAPMSDMRTGKNPYVNRVRGSTLEKPPEKPPNRTGLGRVLLQSEQDVNLKNSSYSPFIRPAPPRPMQVLLTTERKGVQGKVNSNANPYAADVFIDPVTGRMVPRTTSKYFDKDKQTSILGPYASATPTAQTLEREAYQPAGIKRGNLTLSPAVEIVSGYEDNPLRSTGKGSAVVTLAPELMVTSDLPRHSVSADLRGTYTRYQAFPNTNRASFTGSVGGRIDIASDQNLELSTRASLRGETTTASSYNAPTGVTLNNEPLTLSYGATASYSKEFNRLVLTLKGLFDRSQFGVAELSDGTSVSGSDRNYNAYRGAARVSYLLTEHVRPFVEGYEEIRVFDVPLRGGFLQGSHSFGGKVGVRFEAPRRFYGEVGIGYQYRQHKDPTYAASGGLLVDASLIYMPTLLTTLTLNAKTAFEESIASGISTLYRRDLTLNLDHAFRRNLIGSAKFGFGYDSYLNSSGHDERLTAALALTYRLNTSLSLRGEVKHEQSKSYNSTGASFKSNSFLLALRAQR